MSTTFDIKQSMDIDEASRKTIITCLDKNLFVIAGAGSGKTSMLVSRMVAMVESGIDVSKICAITFTKKAAAEFLERFQKKLKERSERPYQEGNKYPGDLPTPTDITAGRCKQALKDIDLCFTGTIDSFCNLVLSEYPNNAGVPSSSVVVMDDELVELCKKVNVPTPIYSVSKNEVMLTFPRPLKQQFEDGDSVKFSVSGPQVGRKLAVSWP